MEFSELKSSLTQNLLENSLYNYFYKDCRIDTQQYENLLNKQFKGVKNLQTKVKKYRNMIQFLIFPKNNII